jgi:hypothetical protein
MSKQKVSAKEVLADIRSGLSDADLMTKYGLTSKGLESLFEKLIERKVLSASEFATRNAAPSQPVEPERPQVDPPAGQRVAEPEIDPKVAKAMVEHVRKGTHKNQLMMEFGLSPSQLQGLLDNMVRLGYLSAEDLESGKPRQTRQCPHCSETLSVGEPRCPNCGKDPDRDVSSEEDGQHEPYDEQVASEELSVDRYCAWEDRASQGTVAAYIQTATRCLMNPADFFAKLPPEGGYWSPILFGAMSAAVAVLFNTLWYQLWHGGFGVFSLIWVFIGMCFVFLLSVIFIPISMFAWSLAVHGTLLALRGGQSGFQTTFRVTAYSMVTTVFSAIPVVGTIASLWGLYLSAVGLRETHETSMGKAAGAVLIPFAVVALVGILFAGLFSDSGSRSPRGGKGKIALQQTAAPLLPETCRELEAFMEKVDAAAAQGTVKGAQPPITAALNEFIRQLQAGGDRKRAEEVKEKAATYAMAPIIVMGLREKGLGDLLGNAEEEIQKSRESLEALCSK